MKKEGSTLLLPIVTMCKTQGQIPTNNMIQHVNTSRLIDML